MTCIVPLPTQQGQPQRLFFSQQQKAPEPDSESGDEESVAHLVRTIFFDEYQRCSTSYQAQQDLEEGLETTTLLSRYGQVINRELGLVICVACKQAYHTKNLAYHLSRHHHLKINKKELNFELTTLRLESSYPTIQSLVDAPVKAYAGLLCTQEYACSVCSRAGSKVYVEKHLRISHPFGGEVVSVWTQVLNKAITRENFCVQPPVSPPKELATDDQETMKAVFAQSYASILAGARSVPNARMISPWLLRTGWHYLTENRSVAPLCELVAQPSTEPSEAWIRPLVLEYFEDASAKISKTGLVILQKLNSTNADQEYVHQTISAPAGLIEYRLNNTPLHQHQQHATTLRAYINPIAHLVAALLRKQAEGIQFPSTPRLDEALGHLPLVQSASALHAVFKALWFETWVSKKEDLVANPTILFLGLFTLKESGEFSMPKEVTGTIAKLTRAIQLAALVEYHEALAATPDALPSSAFAPLQCWLRTGEDTTFSDLVSLQKYASAIAYNTLSFPKVIFPNRSQGDYSTMLFEGQPVAVDQIQEIETRFEDKIVVLLEKDVFLGLKFEVKYDVLRDNLQCTKAGYTFTDDNTDLASQALKLGQAIMDDPVLFQEFMVRGSSGVVEVNVLRARKWLQSLGELELYLMLSVEMKSGSPIRMSELTSTLVRNRNTRIRNLMAVGRHLCIIRQYNKNNNNEQMDRMIPHGLSGFDQDVLIRIHTLARPLAMASVSV